jgi:hypothetical protein
MRRRLREADMNVRITRSGFAALACVALALGACGGKTAAPGVFLSIVSPAQGTSVSGNVVTLDLLVEGVQIKKADGDTSGKTGHFHVFIDREPMAAGQVIPKEAGIVHAAAEPVVLAGLSAGEHTLKVVLGNGAHARLGSALAETKVRVEGPTLDATAPPTVSSGSPVIVTVGVHGIRLVPADKDSSSGTSGHLHVFVDRDPTPAGQVIPKEAGIIHTAKTTISIPNLAPGEHTIWVVFGDRAHIPYVPAVADRVVVVVA